MKGVREKRKKYLSQPLHVSVLYILRVGFVRCLGLWIFSTTHFLSPLAANYFLDFHPPRPTRTFELKLFAKLGLKVRRKVQRYFTPPHASTCWKPPHQYCVLNNLFLDLLIYYFYIFVCQMKTFLSASSYSFVPCLCFVLFSWSRVGFAFEWSLLWIDFAIIGFDVADLYG